MKYAQNVASWLGEYAAGKTKIAMETSRYTPSSAAANLNVYALNRFWWFVSPEVLLVLIVIVILAFSYRWFGGKGLDLYGLWDELRGKK